MAIFTTKDSGASDGVNLPNGGSSVYDGAVDFTIAFWYKHRSGAVSASAEEIYHAEDSSGDRVRIQLTTAELFEIDIDFDATSLIVLTSSTATYITDTSWHHYALSWDASVPRASFFVDGVSDASDTGSGTTTGIIDPTATHSLMVDDDGSPTDETDGILHDFTRFDRNLSSAEITALAEGFSPALLEPSSRVSYYRFIDNLVDEWDGMGNGTWTNTPGADHGFTDDAYPVIYGGGYTDLGETNDSVAQNITAVLLTATGLFAPTSIDQNLDVTAPLISATGLYAAASINQLGVISGVLLGATMLAASIQYDQSVTAPVVNATGPFASGSITQNLDVTAPLLSATGKLVGSLGFDQVITASLLSATGLVTAGSLRSLWTLVSPNTDTDFVVVSPNTDTDFTEVN